MSTKKAKRPASNEKGGGRSKKRENEITSEKRKSSGTQAKKQCQALTAKGGKCKMSAKEGSLVCGIHCNQKTQVVGFFAPSSDSTEEERFISSDSTEEELVGQNPPVAINHPSGDDLVTILERLNVAQLKDLCSKFGLSKSGSKGDIKDRINNSLDRKVEGSRTLYLLLCLTDDLILSFCKKLKIESRGVRVDDCLQILENIEFLVRPDGKQRISNQLKQEIWKRYIGETAQGYCICCGKAQLSVLSFHAGHIIPESKGGSVSVSNLFPICGTCNHSMGDEDLIAYSRRVFPENKFLLKAIGSMATL